MMLLPLAICGVCIVTSIIGTFFVRLGKSSNIMGALYQGLIVTGVLSIARGLVGDPRRWCPAPSTVGGKTFDADALFYCGARRPGGHRPDRGDHRILHRHQLPPGEVGGPGLGLGSRHQRDPGPGHVAGVHRRSRRW